MKKLLVVFYVFSLLICASSVFALSGEHLTEFQGFINNLREEKRVDRLGYLIFVDITPSKAGENRLLSLTGKYFLTTPKGYLTHVNYARLARLKQAKIEPKVLDKKRLDDRSEHWYLIWVENSQEAETLKKHFEPLFKHEQTWVVRVRPEDEEVLQSLEVEYSIIEEDLLPLKLQPQGKKFVIKEKDPKIVELIQQITGENLASTVQTLQDCKSRYVREPGIKVATTWLKEEFEKIGSLTVATPGFTSYYGELSNVIATKQGEKNPGSAYVICGHFDSTVKSYQKTVSPGADDNGSGAAGVLESARIIGRMRFPDTIIFACWNAEEVGLVGSKAYAKTLAETQGLEIKAVFNMDMIADNHDDNEVAVIGNSRSNWLIDVFKDAALLYTGLKSDAQYDSNIWYSDHSSFWNIGASAILTIEGYPEMTPYYHSTKDLLSNMSIPLMERTARSNLAAFLTLNYPIFPEKKRR